MKKTDFLEMGLTVPLLVEMIDQKVFSERDRKILKRKFVDGLTFEEVAEEYYLSTQRIKAIVAFHKKRLFKD